ncbi:Negative regulator of systemic acquired resistance SNI1 [Zea mays]|uniref:Negative regulator of systemic acquired resistance SNI1 n=1 Tax=Zea mays TaxID=4577 RepID=A0A3L6F818_MAIZE|nr:Negative regulator of systemic acquired resistance SNI1 [Zea mays]
MAASHAPASVAAATDGVIEENVMAILDSSGIKDSRDLHDDRNRFLRSPYSSIDSSIRRMYDGVFQILQNSSSLELAVASFHLLTELGKQYPRTHVADSGGHQSLVVVKESWVPFLFGNGAVSSEIGGNVRSSDHLFDPSYLVNTLEADFVPRQIATKESLDWVIFRESLLSMLLGSRKLVFKSFVKNCMCILLNQYYHEAKDDYEDIIPSERETESTSYHNFSLNYLSFELKKTLISLRKLFVMVMKLDLTRKEADTLGLTSRADGFRNSIMDIILDELTYNSSYLSPFLLAFVERKWKLEIILQYFSKYCGKGAVRTRRSDNSQEDLKLENVLNFFVTATSAKAIVRKMSAEIAQLLLTHAYQACLSAEDANSNSADTPEKVGATLQEISSNFIAAFQNIRKVSPDIQISPFEKEALFTAATLVRKLKSKER